MILNETPPPQSTSHSYANALYLVLPQVNICLSGVKVHLVCALRGHLTESFARVVVRLKVLGQNGSVFPFLLHALGGFFTRFIPFNHIPLSLEYPFRRFHLLNG